jgi:hypothetical protein
MRIAFPVVGAPGVLIAGRRHRRDPVLLRHTGHARPAVNACVDQSVTVIHKMPMLPLLNTDGSLPTLL